MGLSNKYFIISFKYEYINMYGMLKLFKNKVLSIYFPVVFSKYIFKTSPEGQLKRKVILMTCI